MCFSVAGLGELTIPVATLSPRIRVDEPLLGAFLDDGIATGGVLGLLEGEVLLLEFSSFASLTRIA